MNKFRIYYCIDINLWYIDKDDGLHRTTQAEQEIFDSETEAVNFFIKYHDGFLNEQKDMLLSAGQKSQAKENICYLQISNMLYEINNDGTWKCKCT